MNSHCLGYFIITFPGRELPEDKLIQVITLEFLSVICNMLVEAESFGYRPDRASTRGGSKAFFTNTFPSIIPENFFDLESAVRRMGLDACIIELNIILPSNRKSEICKWILNILETCWIINDGETMTDIHEGCGKYLSQAVNDWSC